ncbi:MAG: urease accessory protein UreE [Pseudomonadota bacterium]
MLTSQTYHDHGHRAPAETLSLTYEDRFLRRKVLTCLSGVKVLVDLPKTTSLDHGGVLVTTTGEEVAIVAADEPLLEVRGDLVRLAWHVGNRHTPCQLGSARLLIQRDAVMADMLTRLGAEVRDVVEPFTPEGGAYGMGRTHSHSHGHSHEEHDHAHS